MSTRERTVPVNLIAGKEYVMRMGRHVIVKDNPHWQCAAKFPFIVMQGPDFIVYLTPEGQADPAGGENEYDITRPVYKEGGVYLRSGQRYEIYSEDSDDTYPLNGRNEGRGDNINCFTRDGRVLYNESNTSDLMDYAPVPVSAPVCGITILPLNDTWVGKRVHFIEDGLSGIGLVLREFPNLSGRFEVRADPPFAGHGTAGLKWHVWRQNLRLADANVGITPTPSIVQGALPDLVLLDTLVTPSRVGMRVEVQLDCATTTQATIMYEDATHVAIEFDPDYHHSGAWTCDGHVPSGRGWYVPKDSVRAVGEAATRVEDERKEVEALNEADVSEVWAAYRINPSIAIESWIEARRVLKAAAK